MTRKNTRNTVLASRQQSARRPEASSSTVKKRRTPPANVSDSSLTPLTSDDGEEGPQRASFNEFPDPSNLCVVPARVFSVGDASRLSTKSLQCPIMLDPSANHASRLSPSGSAASMISPTGTRHPPATRESSDHTMPDGAIKVGPPSKRHIFVPSTRSTHSPPLNRDLATETRNQTSNNVYMDVNGMGSSSQDSLDFKPVKKCPSRKRKSLQSPNYLERKRPRYLPSTTRQSQPGRPANFLVPSRPPAMRVNNLPIDRTLDDSGPQSEEERPLPKRTAVLQGSELFWIEPSMIRSLDRVYDPLIRTLLLPTEAAGDAPSMTTDEMCIESLSEQARFRSRALRRFHPWDGLGYRFCPLGFPCWDLALGTVASEIESNPAVVLRGGHFWAPDPYLLFEEFDTGAATATLNYMRLHPALFNAFKRVSAAKTALDITEDAEASGSTCLSGRLWKHWILGPDISAVLSPDVRQAKLPRKINEVTKILRMRASIGLSNELLFDDAPQRHTHPQAFHPNVLAWWNEPLEPLFIQNPTVMAFILFELCNVHFALEFRSLDAKLTKQNPCDRILFIIPFLGDTLGIPVSAPRAESAWDFSSGLDGFRRLLRMGEVMRDWNWQGAAVLPSDVRASLQDLSKTTSVKPSAIRALEVALCLAYCRAFVKVFDRAPILPRQFPDRDFLRRRGLPLPTAGN
ncbi:hypothetical protein PUNSTDRAFT_47263 [Punctularia strigosozonata HHB-11173 SS5]|uniref:Uncharacterized protein n=1 Tax=Punctularia strigosozonata (strain HHB-11173) TaxID=741275 RepID=R7S584_PUNST|nr:uncharacterized protein PUNSTDRAFT_47263 [Punctularia strigosozonata HHB-11173 SS5]EIN05047.1 hypothetical protein PUNSTDRAFT_47263 [Punctularia strigosozonata HHB-11173 SS5]